VGVVEHFPLHAAYRMKGARVGSQFVKDFFG
jgi:hypothetical protein